MKTASQLLLLTECSGGAAALPFVILGNQAWSSKKSKDLQIAPQVTPGKVQMAEQDMDLVFLSTVLKIHI